MAERCDLIGGSFFEEVPRGADLYLLKHVIHDWDDARATQILANVRSALSPGGRLLVVEGIYPERIDSSAAGRGAAANDVNMLVVTGGRQRSEAEFRELYRAAGVSLAGRGNPGLSWRSLTHSRPLHGRRARARRRRLNSCTPPRASGDARPLRRDPGLAARS
jgi:hypothetical protein